MTADEIQALRRKHCICTCGYCGNNECEAGCVGEYPCDAIKVLDYLEVVGQAYEKNVCLVCGIVIYQDCDPQIQVLNTIEVPEL